MIAETEEKGGVDKIYLKGHRYAQGGPCISNNDCFIASVAHLSSSTYSSPWNCLCHFSAPSPALLSKSHTPCITSWFPWQQRQVLLFSISVLPPSLCFSVLHYVDCFHGSCVFPDYFLHLILLACLVATSLSCIRPRIWNSIFPVGFLRNNISWF